MAIVVDAHDPGRGEAVQVLVDPRQRDARGLHGLVGGAIAADEHAGDRQSLRVGERPQDLVGGLSHVGLPACHGAVQLTDPQRRTLEA